ncbi:unnamed protein product [Strongylus vulgaris]|uniref:Uncharacterized protein n=1 Tax=Strongylus vulgaris TaxID=40348 RepID=A0A3P7JID9_STRVU|nr:unnamed protein product [Strongylus vulgaris]
MEHFYYVKDKLKKTTGNKLEMANLLRRCCLLPAVAPPADLVKGQVPLITAEEVWLAITKTKNGKAFGPDDIPSEFRKECVWSVLHGLQPLQSGHQN